MLMHVYGVIDSRDLRCSAPLGHEADAVTAFPVGGLAAVVSRAAGGTVDATIARVWHHEKVLDALMRGHAVLPIRFGTVCRAGDLSSFLNTRLKFLQAGLRTVGGKVEMAVRIAQQVPQPQTEEGGKRGPDRSKTLSGRAYLLALTAGRHSLGQNGERMLQPADDIKEFFDQLAFKTIWQGPEAGGASFRASCLVAWEDLDTFVSGLAKLERPELTLSCTGPWAPYSFVGLEPAPGLAG